MHRTKALAALFILLLASQIHADVRLHAMFTDNMVLQRGVSVPIWGWASDGEQVTVEYEGRVAKTRAKGGKWMVRLKNLKTGGPSTLQVAGKNRIALANVVVGEVWLASGQSN